MNLKRGWRLVRRLTISLGLWGVLAILFIFTSLTPATRVSASGFCTYYVQPSGNDNNDGLSWENAKLTIASAISAAAPGDTIKVAGGTYAENLEVNKEGLTITSEGGPGLCIIQTPDNSSPVIVVRANNVKIIGFTIENAVGPSAAGILLQGVRNCRIEGNILLGDNYGIRLEGSENNRLSNNTLQGNFYGISLQNSMLNTILNNSCEANLWAGIFLESSSCNTLSGNSCGGGMSGIQVRNSSNNVIDNNSSQGNLNGGIQLESSTNNFLSGNFCSSNSYGIYLDTSSNNIIVNNACDSNIWAGVLLNTSSGNRIEGNSCEGNRAGIILESSSNNILLNNSSTGNNWEGIRLGNSSGNTLQKNTCGGNGNDGIRLEHSSGNSIENNTCGGNSERGIYLVYSSSNTLSNNTCEGNGWGGICLGYSSSNTIENNTCEENPQGISLEHSTANTLSANTCGGNSYGIHAIYSSTNTIYLNHLLNNSENNAFDNGSNSWDHEGKGNWWSDWQPPEHPDADVDGVIDVPRPIAGGSNSDRCPLTFPYFWLSAEPKSILIHQGEEETVRTTVTGVNYDLVVSLTATGQPPEVSLTLSPENGVPTFTSLVRIAVGSDAPTGTYTITVGGTGADGMEAIAAFDLEVAIPPDFTIGVTPISASVEQGGSATMEILVAPVGDFSEQVDLSVSGLPSGTTVTFSPSSGIPGFSSTLTISTSSTTPTENYTITVSGVGGGKSRSATCTLTVIPAPDFTIEVTPTSWSIMQGESAAATITVNPVGNFTEPITLSVPDLPEGVTASLDPVSETPPFTSVLVISTSPTAPPGTYTLTVRGANGGKAHTVTLSLTLTPIPPPPFPWGFIIGAIAAIAVVIVVVFLYRRRRAAWAPS